MEVTADEKPPPDQPAPNPEAEIDVGDPAALREAIAAALNTTDTEILVAVAEDFRGIYHDPMEYIRQQLLDLLPSWSAWLLECCDNDRLRLGYEAGKLLVWTLPHPFNPRKRLIFESLRARFRAR